jgi:hypothetical protein
LGSCSLAIIPIAQGSNSVDVSQLCTQLPRLGISFFFILFGWFPCFFIKRFHLSSPLSYFLPSWKWAAGITLGNVLGSKEFLK